MLTLALTRGAPMPTKPRASSREVVLSASQGRVNKVSSRLADRGHRLRWWKKVLFCCELFSAVPLSLNADFLSPPDRTA